MLDDVDATLRELLNSALAREKATITFDAPDAAWLARRKAPTLSIFLHRVTEELDGRSADWTEVREGGRVVAHQPPPRRFALTYLVSAFADSTDVEHRLLGTAMAALPPGDAIPAAQLQGRLAAQELAVRFHAEPTAGPAAPAATDLWSALGVPPRAALQLVVVAPVVPETSRDVGPPVEHLQLDAVNNTTVGADAATGEVVKRFKTVRVRESARERTPRR